MDKSKLIKMIVILAAITILAGGLLRITARNSMSLADYASLQADQDNAGADSSTAPEDSFGSIPASTDKPAITGSDHQGSTPSSTDRPSLSDADGSEDTYPSADLSDANVSTDTPSSKADPDTCLVGASLNGTSQLEQRTVLAEGFYYEPISDNLRRYMTGISYPVTEGEGAVPEPAITFEELRYLHILHYNFEGESTQGELICNAAIAQDLAEIFQELYLNEYQLEKVLLIDTYDGDDNASMEDNNTSCFNYRVVEGTTRLSRHAYGLAVDINPLYNPYITYGKNGAEQVSPVSALPYADRSNRFAYKIDKEDLCYKLFTDHGFTWGGNWNSSKDYQHFQKNLP